MEIRKEIWEGQKVVGVEAVIYHIIYVMDPVARHSYIFICQFGHRCALQSASKPTMFFQRDTD